MRYHKGLGVGHIYSSLKAGDEMLSPDHELFVSYQEQLPNAPIIIEDDEISVALRGGTPNATEEDIDQSREGSDRDSDDDSVFDNPGDIDDDNWIPGRGSDDDDDDLELEYHDMYSDSLDVDSDCDDDC